MPEIVAEYARDRDLTALKPVYDSLLTSYLDDVPKYARNSTDLGNRLAVSPRLCEEQSVTESPQ
jgi:hypothetical protein